MDIFLMILILFVALIFEVPVYLSVFGAIMCFCLFLTEDIPVDIAIQQIVGSSRNLALLAIPFFIMLGSLMSKSGITTRMLAVAEMFVGRFIGGLAQANILLSTLMGGLSASSLADCAMLTKMLVPEMEKKGYNKAFSGAVTAVGSLITPIIPPGIALIIYSLLANVSVGKMFMAGVIPGILSAILLMITTYILSRKYGYKPERSHAIPVKEKINTIKHAFPALLLVVVIIGGIRLGIFTPTEAGSVAVVYILIVGLFIYREMKLSDVIDAAIETIKSTANVMIIIMVCSALGWIFAYEQTSQAIATYIMSITDNKYVFLLLLNIALLVLGMLIEGTAIMIILVPLLKPLVLIMGIDLIHFGIIIIINMSIATLTPPVGTIMLLVGGLTKVSVKEFLKAVLPFYITLLIILAIVTYIPFISTGLSQLVG